ncbi:universal stress protein [Niabella beijingensis]|uniref:universal stress protein n=1 Tax=Niabella beijingensis TaxID=2872700 RepID=UPI001CBF1FBD|nr:universal stress protein [Niabella beijingensis]MBZ4188425.1 universal stress protein [Niabella beijingensis]
MKTILVPTDLSTESISIVHKALQHSREHKVEIILLHLVQPVHDIGDLLRSSKRRFYSQLPQAFCEAVQVLKKCYLEQAHIRFEICYCNTGRVFRHILESNHITEIYLLNGYSYQTPFKESIRMDQYIAASRLPVFKIDRYKQLHVSKDINLLSNLLLMPEFRKDRQYAKEETVS